ncbi:MAG: hypothetical protein LAT82_04095 [Nanoarchaeota archaeon]|nr:hypothetical protein [Nanoarchaeota archaeon]
MDLLKFTQTKKEDETSSKVIFKNTHIEVIESPYSYKVTVYDEIGLEAMHNTFQISPAKYKIVKSIEELEKFYEESVKDKQEGIMIKVLNKPYKAGKKVGYMYKMKPTSEDIDVVIVAAQRGVGKRGGYFSSFYVAIQNNQGELKTIGKVGSGVTESEGDELSIQKFTTLLTPLIEKVDSKTGITYFKPEIIIQVSYQDLQESQTTQSKYALRFPKVVALRNKDKRLEDITTLDEVLAQKNLPS